MLELADLERALALPSPWTLTSAEATPVVRRLHLGVICPDDSLFDCPRCGTVQCPIDLSWPRTWRHPDFCGYRTYLLARLPDLGCERCGIVPALAPWEADGFALLTLSPGRRGLAEWAASGMLPFLDGGNAGGADPSGRHVVG